MYPRRYVSVGRFGYIYNGRYRCINIYLYIAMNTFILTIPFHDHHCVNAVYKILFKGYCIIDLNKFETDELF